MTLPAHHQQSSADPQNFAAQTPPAQSPAAQSPRTPPPSPRTNPLSTLIATCGRLWDTLQPSTPIGERAAAALHWEPRPAADRCWRCGLPVAPVATTPIGCAYCWRSHVPWDRCYSLGAYESPLSDWILELKFHGVWLWAEYFGRELARVTPDWPDSIVVPIPLHWLRRFTRRYDQSLLIARAFGAAKGLPVAPILRRTRYTRPQTQLAFRTHRFGNVRRAFAARSIDLQGRGVWLVDDVKTTGATAGRCAKLLRRCGAGEIRLLTVAVAKQGGLTGNGLGMA